jgi:hypothetical protein
MGHRPSCRSCRHCLPAQGEGQQGWCQLRQLGIHPELVGELWCHHWTARPPRLPVIAAVPGSAAPPQRNQQLSLPAVIHGR